MTTGEGPSLLMPGEEALELKHPYTVVNVEPFTSEVHGYQGYRVILDGGEDHQLAIALWHRPVASRTSKWGSFAVALGEDMSKWLARVIKVISWEPRNRVVEEVK